VRGLPATAESDLWSLGATLFTAVEGHPPFGGTSAGAVFVAVATEEPAPAVHAGPLGPAISGLLRKNPAERLTADQLHPLLAQQPAPERRAPISPPPIQHPGSPAHPHPPILGPSSPRRRSPTLIAVVIAAALAVIVAAVFVGYVMAERMNDPYQSNRHAARELGAPAGYTAKSEEDIGSGRLRKTFSSCSPMCPPGQRVDRVEAVRQWLRSMSGVQAVGTIAKPEDCFNGMGGCLIQVEASRRPTISNVRIQVAADGSLLLKIEVG
jgi:hypothetical protein